MNTLPPRLLILTFNMALVLKLVGVAVALILGYFLIEAWIWSRWWLAMVSGIFLLFWLLPWPRGFPTHYGRLVHLQLITALALAVLFPFLDVVQSGWSPYAQLLKNPLFVQIGWPEPQVNHIHMLELLFVMVPVVLAAWQYGRFGMWLTLSWAGVLYLVTPFFMPRQSYHWGIYAVEGFVALGVTLILGLTVETLGTAQRQEEAALKVANQKLVQQAALIEHLATGRERHRLARELHDTLAHTLSGTAVQLQAVSTLLKISPETAAAELTTAQQQIRHGLEEARRAITALRASPLEDLGLVEALRQRVTNLGERAGLMTNCQIADLPASLPPLVEQTIYRIADESLLNAEKHAQATRLCLSLSQEADHIILTVQDDGIGFDLEQVKGNGRFGLIGMKERAILIGAALDVRSSPGQGTTVQLSVPSNQYSVSSVQYSVSSTDH